MDAMKDWGKKEALRYKEAFLKELDPRNPNKNRLVSAWGLIIAGFMLLACLSLLYKMYKDGYE